MTDKKKTSKNRSNRNSRGPVTKGFCCAVLVAVLAPAAIPAQDAPSVIHFIDTNTDRIPALTAFPKYPAVARRDRIQGEATVCFKIRANGKISRPVVTESSHRIFAKPAIRAIKKSNFEPISPGQILATARTCRVYRFRLEPVLAKTDPAERN